MPNSVSKYARILSDPESLKYNKMTPEAWFKRYAIIPADQIPQSSGYGFVQSPYLSPYTKIWGVSVNADYDKYLTLYRTVPIIRRAIDKKVEMAFGRGFNLKLPANTPNGDEIIKLCNDWLRRINIKEYAISVGKDLEIFGNSVTEICYIDEEISQTEIPLEKAMQSPDGKITITSKPIKEKVTEYKGGTKKNTPYGNLPTWLKPLDPRFMRVRRDSYGNIFGWMMWIQTPPVAFLPSKIIHYKMSPWNIGYENAYGVSSLMSLIQLQDYIWQIERDANVVSHTAAKIPAIFDEHDAERYASNTEFSALKDLLAGRNVGSDIFLRYGFKATPMQPPTAMLAQMKALLDYYCEQRIILLGVPKSELGIPEGSTRTMAAVSQSDFIASVKIIQETFSNTFEQEFFTKLLRPIFGEDVAIPDMVWKDVTEEDINQKANRLTNLRRIGTISTNEARIEMGYEKTTNPEDDEVKPVQIASPWGSSFPTDEIEIKEKTEDKPENKLPIEKEKKASIEIIKKNNTSEVTLDCIKNINTPPTVDVKKASKNKYVKPYPKEKETLHIIKRYITLIKNHLDILESEYLNEIESLTKIEARIKSGGWEFKASAITQSERDDIDAIIENCVKIGLSRAEDDADVDYIKLYNKNFVLKLQDDQVGYITKLDKDIRARLNKEISEGISSGETYTQLRDRIRKTFTDIGYNRAELIATTEITRAQELTYKESGKEMGFIYKRFIVQPDEFVCAICNGDDPESETRPGKVFPMDVDVVPNKTHPRCRCYTVFVDEADVSPDDLL